MDPSESDATIDTGAAPLIAARYQPIALLGKGGHGEVWRARDVVSRRDVAVKLLRADVAVAPARVQLEVAALRQRLPGVVELIDDGIDAGRPYLVMELVEGAPFPGRPTPAAWSDIVDVTVALLETLGRVHAASVIHRDLKPENVLVTAERQIKILDFGLAYRAGQARDERLTARHEILGTPAFISPEQLRGGAGDQRSDLYSVGLMLYAALAGELPHKGSHLGELFFARLNQRPAPLDQVVSNIPEVVARVVESLLAVAPEDRPGSAFEVLARLRGEAAIEAPHFPWLGDQAPLQRLVDAVRRGGSIDIVGPRGSGRTRCLLAVDQALSGERRVVWIRPSERAFAGLAPIVGTLDEHASAGLDEVTELVDARLRDTLRGGAVLFVDDAADIDRLSAEALGRCRDAGSIVRAFAEQGPGGPSRQGGQDVGLDDAEVRLRPLREEDLRSLFAGPDRLLHLREDAAQELYRRTSGLQARVTHEVTTWVNLGVARWLRNLLVVSRDGIDRLELGFQVSSPVEDDTTAAVASLAAPLADMLAWITLAWPHARLDTLARLKGDARFRVEHDLNQLCARGLVRRLEDGRIEPRSHGAVVRSWTPARHRSAHSALAEILAPGDEGRLLHLLLGAAEPDGVQAAVGREARVLAERLVDEGRSGRAVAAIASGLRSLRGLGTAAALDLERLLGLLVETAIDGGTPHALDRALYEICRTEPRTTTLARLEALARAALGVEDFTGQALLRADAVAPFGDRRMERIRLGVRVAAARHHPGPEREEEVLAEISASCLEDDVELRARLDTWTGHLRYRQGRYRDAARLNHQAAQRTSSVFVRVYALVWGALASMDDFDFAEARATADEARRQAAHHRHAYHELFATWILRAVDYRTDQARQPDLELLGAVPHVGRKQLDGVVHLNEAAIAWRWGKRDVAARLAREALRSLSAIGHEDGSLLAASLLVALGEPADRAHVSELCARVKGGLMPGIGVQALALVARAGKLPGGVVDRERLEALTTGVPPACWGLRMDLLSMDESLDALRPHLEE
jgi:hypothetical protein